MISDWRVTGRVAAMLIALLSIALGSFLLWTAPAEPLTTADSAGYIDFYPIRTAGYPLFLRAFGVAHAVAAQIALFTLGAGLLGWALYRASGRLWVAGIAMVACFVNPELAKFHYSILTESLFISLTILLFAAMVMAASSRRCWWLLVAAAIAGLATAVRPTGWSLLPPLLLLVFLLPDWRAWRGWLGVGAACLALVFGIVGAERFYARSVHGDQLSSLAPRHLFAKAALIDAPPMDRGGMSPFDLRLADVLERDAAPVRQLLDSAREERFHSALLNDYEVCLQWACLDSALPRNVSEKAIDESLRRVAIRRIQGNPVALVRLAGDEYVAVWTIGARTHPAAAPLYDRFVASLRPVPLERPLALSGALAPTQPRTIARIAQPMFFAFAWAMGVVVLVAIVGLWRRRDRHSLLLLALCAALIVESSLVMTAVLAVGYPRYSMAMWPMIVVALLLLFTWSWAWMTERRSYEN